MGASLKEKYYDYVLKNLKEEETSLAEKIVFSLMCDFTDRRGLRHAWEDIDNDIQEEIIKEWITITQKTLKNKGEL